LKKIEQTEEENCV